MVAGFPLDRVFALAALALGAACATYPDVIPPPPAAVERPSQRDRRAAAVFQRAPWELRDMPGGLGRYHQKVGMLFPDASGPFLLTDASVHDPEGRDVSLQYVLSDDSGRQARAFITVRVYLAGDDADGEFKTAVARMQANYPGSERADTVDLSASQPAPARQSALFATVNASGTEIPTFAQTSLFAHGPWLVRLDVRCARTDLFRLQTEIRRLATSFIP